MREMDGRVFPNEPVKIPAKVSAKNARMQVLVPGMMP